jgi:hypothetical protein
MELPFSWMACSALAALVVGVVAVLFARSRRGAARVEARRRPPPPAQWVPVDPHVGAATPDPPRRESHRNF